MNAFSGLQLDEIGVINSGVISSFQTKADFAYQLLKEQKDSGTDDKNAIQINAWWEGTFLGSTKHHDLGWYWTV